MKGIIETHEPEIHLQEMALTTPRVTIAPPNLALVAGSVVFPERTTFSDSLLDFGVQRKRRAFATLS